MGSPPFDLNTAKDNDRQDDLDDCRALRALVLINLPYQCEKLVHLFHLVVVGMNERGSAARALFRHFVLLSLR